jgi:hypothetical protein
MIAPEDTFIVGDGRLSHLDCHRPRVLSPEERVVLFRFCSEHTVSECEQCAKAYRLSELASDLFSGREHQCPRCRADLIASVRAHLYNGAILLATVLQRLREAREVAHRLVKRGEEPSASLKWRSTRSAKPWNSRHSLAPSRWARPEKKSESRSPGPSTASYQPMELQVDSPVARYTAGGVGGLETGR